MRNAPYRRAFTFRTMVFGLLAAGVAAVSASEPPASLWVADPARLGSALLEIDVATGERSLVDLEDYPNVLTVSGGVQADDGTLFLGAVNAAQGVTIIRFDPAAGSVVGISGFVDGSSFEPRGAGPDFQPGLRGIVVGPWGRLYCLRRLGGPMSVDVATGDRLVISQSATPRVGDGVELRDPLDLVVEPRGTLLVADRFANLMRVTPGSGRRTTAFEFVDLIEGPHRIERLPDGRVLHAFGAGDGRSISVFDLSLRSLSELSGPGRGAGPELAGLVDFVVAPDGSVYALDLALRAVVAIDPETGDRTLVAEDPEGADLGLLSGDARLVGFAVPNGPPSPRNAGGRVAAPGP
jgi:hypothetical protein